MGRVAAVLNWNVIDAVFSFIRWLHYLLVSLRQFYSCITYGHLQSPMSVQEAHICVTILQLYIVKSCPCFMAATVTLPLCPLHHAYVV